MMSPLEQILTERATKGSVTGRMLAAGIQAMMPWWSLLRDFELHHQEDMAVAIYEAMESASRDRDEGQLGEVR